MGKKVREKKPMCVCVCGRGGGGVEGVLESHVMGEGSEVGKDAHIYEEESGREEASVGWGGK